MFEKRKAEYEKATAEINKPFKPKACEKLLGEFGFPAAQAALSAGDLVRRGIPLKKIAEEFDILDGVSPQIVETVEIDAKYAGYIIKEQEQIDKAKKLEEKLLPESIDYLKMEGLRLEARQKLDKIRPKNLGQAGRISGVSPADIAVLMVYLKN